VVARRRAPESRKRSNPRARRRVQLRPPVRRKVVGGRFGGLHYPAVNSTMPPYRFTCIQPCRRRHRPRHPNARQAQTGSGRCGLPVVAGVGSDAMAPRSAGKPLSAKMLVEPGGHVLKCQAGVTAAYSGNATCRVLPHYRMPLQNDHLVVVTLPRCSFCRLHANESIGIASSAAAAARRA